MGAEGAPAPLQHPSSEITPPLSTRPSVSASEHCLPSFPPKKDLVSSPFKSGIFSLDYNQ